MITPNTGKRVDATKEVSKRKKITMAGIIFAYIGAITRWLFSGFKGKINQRFLGDETDDLTSHLSSSVLNRVIGIIVFIIIIGLIGFIQKNSK